MTVQTTDLMLVNRGGVDYQATVADVNAADTTAAKTDAANNFTQLQTFSKGVLLGGRYVQKAIALGNAHTIDCALGNYFTTTVTSAGAAFVFNNRPTAPNVWSGTLEISYSGGTVTWPNGFRWHGGKAPLFVNGTNFVAVWTRDQGLTWYGTYLGVFTAP